MDPSLVGSLISGVAPLIASAIGDAIAAGDTKKATALAEQAAARYRNLMPPEIQKLVPEQQGASGLNDVMLDPKLRNAQMSALDALQAEVNSKGMTPQDFAAAQQAEQDAGRQESGFRGALEQSMAGRGLGGAGAYAGALSAQQGTVNRSALQGTRIAADARDRYLNAINALSSTAGGVRGQEYGMARDKATANDAINAANTRMRWDAAQLNQQIPQQQFENKFALTKAQSGADNDLASYYAGRANDTRQTARGYGQAIGGLGKMGTAAYSKMKDDEDKP